MFPDVSRSYRSTVNSVWGAAWGSMMSSHDRAQLGDKFMELIMVDTREKGGCLLAA